MTLLSAAPAFALAADFARAEQLVERLAKDLPAAIPLHRIIIPNVRSLELIDQEDPLAALERLRTAEKYELAFRWGPVLWMKGEALLALGRGDDAAAAFQKILDHPGVFSEEIEYSLAHLGLGRAKVLMGDEAAARKNYQDFFALWKDADPDIPTLLKARVEYQKLH